MNVAARTTTEIDMPDRRRGLSALTWERVQVGIAGAALLIGALAVLLALYLAISWYNRPFLGVMISPQVSKLTINDMTPLGGENWTGLQAGLRPDDRILKLDDISFENVSNPERLLTQALSERRFGQEITLQVFREVQYRISRPRQCAVSTAEGATCNYTYRLMQMPVADFVAQFGVGFVVALVILGIGALLWFLRRHLPAARSTSILCGALAIIIIGRFELVTTYQTTLLFVLAACIGGAAILHLAMSFPYEIAVLRRHPWLRVLPFVLGLLGFLIALVGNQFAPAELYYVPQLVGSTLLVVACAIFTFSLVYGRRHTASPALRDQAGIGLIGAAVTLFPGFLWLITTVLARVAATQWSVDLSGITFSSVFILPSLAVFPLALAYAMLQHRLIESDQVVSESLIYAALGVMLIIGYLLLTGAAYILTWGAIRFDSPLLIAITLFVIAVAFTPMRLRLERIVDRAFFKQARFYESRLEQFARSLTTSVDMNDAVKKLNEQLDETIAPQYAFIFLRNLATGEYEAYTDPATGKAQTDIHFAPDSALIRMLRGDQSILYFEPGQPLPAEVFAERARLAVLNTPVIARLQSADRLNGFIGLGPRQNRAPYRYDEFRLIEGLADQAAAAFERSQMIIEAQRSARELRVLAQVSAALNIPMDFDTLLEFIYTQTDKVISAPNFYIALRDERHDELYYAFYQEEGERIPEQEGYRWRIGRDLISDVIRTGQPIKTDNYAAEMARRDNRIRLENNRLHAWMGVPLNAGTGQALGCLAIATTDPVITYTEDQIRIFWAIADLAATAIYKARLFTETEERARQMKALNDISSRLASEFENLDALLHVITESAVEMLRGEAGSLLLRDELSGDLIFLVAVGGAGQELVGSRIPAGSGIAGTVVQTGRHVIVNDTQQDTRWYGEVNREESEHKFSTRAILAVPLATRGGVIGVLEIINKKDGTNFVEDEVNLLTAFAGQAAVAIENTRLFQMTDQALADRVQQLDNMQRIDQELNRTLDLQRVVDLTIDNALRESRADAGALALIRLDPLSFVIAGSIGYPQDILTPGESYPITLGIMGKVYRTAQSVLITEMEMASDRDYVQTLPGARSQLAVPLITGSTVSAVLLLESMDVDTFNMITTSFIQGLAEHANTAITNAQLFAQLQEANQARSKFVSFVAHELKNPMTSIKGYAEVLLGGVTGQLNDQQQNFIAVIQRNAVRVQQLVTDLNDITAQETGNLALKIAPISFNNVIVETLRPQQRAIEEKQQKVVLNVPENLPLVLGDELRLIQVMTNFVSNAYKYTPPGGTITIMAEHAPNHWDLQGPEEVVHCAVSDTGIGMSEEDLQKLFTAYWRSDNPRAREQPGTGLGMTLTRGLIEAHGGKIWVESTLDVGTTFHFTVPLATETEKMATGSRR
jgi:signal transduction histidine kinase